MEITQASIYFSPVNRRPASTLGGFVGSRKHNIAFSSDLGTTQNFRALKKIKVAPDVTLKAVSSKSKALTPSQQLALAKAGATAGSAFLPIIKTYYPRATTGIDGFEFIFSTVNAVHAWQDPKRTNLLKPILKTSRALVELFDLLKTVAPTLGPLSPHIQKISIIVKVGDTLFRFYSDATDIVNA